MKQISFDKSDDLQYEGRYGFGYSCGVNVVNRPSQKALRIEVVNSKGTVAPCYIEIPADKAQELADLLISTAGVPSNGIPSVEQLMDQYGAWSEHPTYTREQWMTAVVMKDTQRGYWGWVQVRVEVDRDMEDENAVLPSPNSLG